MTEKTIKCASCTTEFTFEENPKYPRKYCLNCSAKKKKEFAQGSSEDVKPGPGWTGEGKPAVLEIDTASGEVTMGEPMDNLEYEIRSREVRCRALTIADGNKEGIYIDKEKLIAEAKSYEKYILTGE